ncbi:MAG: TlpA family protein disulfide reductase, partial [Rhizorhabdus sp.]|nr:TlpA family protein disulfide reductase [Rhizorhabdus sp.]
ISRITAAGPSAKRPPHILLESPVRPLIVSLLALALAACDSKPASPPQGGVPPESVGSVDIASRGKEMPAIPFTGPKGGPATLTQFRGKPLMVNLWATWCAPCVAEMPTLDDVARREGDRVHLIVVSQDMEGAKVVAPFFAKKGFATLEPYLDQQNVLMQALGTETLPTTIFFDAKGKEQWRVLGAMDWNGAKAKKLIDEALNPPSGHPTS